MADWRSFAERLLELRDSVAPDRPTRFWYPIVDRPLERGHNDLGPSAVEVLRAIALARLALPLHIDIQAPLATLGAKLAQVALEFGASHLGWVTTPGQNSEDPLVADAQILNEVSESFVPTALTEEAKTA